MTDETTPVVAEVDYSFAKQAWWQKPLIWIVFLALLYSLREIFLIGFLTFLFCFIVRSLVGLFGRRISPGRENLRLELMLTISIFLGICLAFYGLGRFFVPEVIRQSKSLAAQMKNISAVEVQNMLLANTVGNWQFNQKYGSPKDPRYEKAFADYQDAGRSGEGLYQMFPNLHSRLQSEFEAHYEQTQVLYLQSHDANAEAASLQLKNWFLETKAPQLFNKKSDYYVSRWEAEYASADKTKDLVTLQNQPDFLSLRDTQIRNHIWADVKADPVLFAQLKTEWNQTASIKNWDEFQKSPAYQAQFKSFYESQFESSPDSVPITYSLYQQFLVAYPKGKQAFLDAVREHQQQEPESPQHQQFDFESVTKRDLAQQWWAQSHTADWVRDRAAEDGPAMLNYVIDWFDKAVSHLVRVPLQVFTALILSVFMLVEWHGVKDGIMSLRDTRVRPIYDEIAPGVIALGKLIGKSFEGQVVISFLNACLTLTFLWIIGVEYKFVLALMVFVFSFIPVVGVILSGAPICAIAILQPGGSLWMALQVVLAIATVHLVEGMILSPRIIGKIGHLHPILVIAILLVAEHFFGMWGLVLGVPVSIYLIRVVILNSPIPGIYEPAEPARPTAI